MLKQDIAYKDFDDNLRQDALYFNITKSELMENLDLKPQLEELGDILSGPPRELTESEVLKILAVVKRLVELAYGERSADGTRFRKSSEIWEDFKSSMAYDAFIMSLFENPEAAVKFMTGILPKDLLAQIPDVPAGLVEAKGVEIRQTILDEAQNLPEQTGPSAQEMLANLSPEELQAVLDRARREGMA